MCHLDRGSRRLRPRWLARASVLAAVATVAALIGLAAACSAREPKDWESVKAKIRQRFPDVPQLTTAELTAWLADPSRQPPILLDARAPEEYAVSHLDGARLTPDEGAALAALAGLPRDRPVVVYCSVGWRSSALAEQLLREGFGHVYNLEGSLFEWANQGRPLVRDGRPVRAVHPYDETWGQLLDRDLWAREAGRNAPGDKP